MFNHVMLGSNDLNRSKAFYDAVIGAMGGTQGVMDPKDRLVYAHRGGRLLITRPIDGQPATRANGFTLGFVLDSAAEVDAWHDAGTTHGGATCEDPPGLRPGGAAGVYLAYLRDPDGNKLCAVHRIAG